MLKTEEIFVDTWKASGGGTIGDSGMTFDSGNGSMSLFFISSKELNSHMEAFDERFNNFFLQRRRDI